MSPEFFSLSQLRRMKGREQVAAVCYRIRKTRLEFLLVQSRGGRWIFPKGSTESGLSNAQAAALEAFEEAGVHGRMEKSCFARYIHRKGGKSEGRPRKGLSVHVHLCQVVRLSAPKESNRKPTWFSAEKAKRRLRQRREPECAADLARVLDLAIAQIRTLQDGTDNQSWRQVCFESFQQDAIRAEPGMGIPPRERGFLKGRFAESAYDPGANSRPALLRVPQLTSGSGPREDLKAVQVINITDAARRRRRRSVTS